MDERLLSRLQALCSRREYCTADIMAKLAGAEDASEIVEALKADGFFSDLRYATAFARDKASLTGWGPIKIGMALSAKGISKETISAALAEIDAPKASERLEKILEVKYKSLREDPECKLKLLRFALGRGYRYEDVAPVVDGLLKRDR